MLGQMGLPGGGYNYALGAVANYGKRMNAVPVAALPQGQNGVRDFIPVARITDMLLNPGEPFDYNGQRLTYPDIKLVYWAGGNPFHHHQDINRLRRAFFGIETLVVHEIAWTATARHADIVLPCTMTLEREDIGATPTDQLMLAMHRLGEAVRPGARRLRHLRRSRRAARQARGLHRRTQQPRLAAAHLRDDAERRSRPRALPAPDFDSFWREGELELPALPADGGILRAFRDDPQGKPLPTPSGKIEIFSKTIAGFGYADCPGHPVWLPPSDVPEAATPLHLVANQPATRLHSQFDFGGHSDAEKQRGREVMSIHPRRCGRARHQGRRHRRAVQRARCLSCGGARHRRHPRRRGAAADRRLVRPGRCGRRQPALRARQSQRADARRRHVLARARLLRTAHDRAGRAVRRQPAADQGVRAAAGGRVAGDHGADKIVNRSLPRSQTRYRLTSS